MAALAATANRKAARLDPSAAMAYWGEFEALRMSEGHGSRNEEKKAALEKVNSLAAFCLLTSAFCLLTSAFCFLPTAFRFLLSAFCFLPTAFRFLLSAYCLLLSAFCLKPTPHA